MALTLLSPDGTPLPPEDEGPHAATVPSSFNAAKALLLRHDVPGLMHSTCDSKLSTKKIVMKMRQDIPK